MALFPTELDEKWPPGKHFPNHSDEKAGRARATIPAQDEKVGRAILGRAIIARRVRGNVAVDDLGGAPGGAAGPHRSPASRYRCADGRDGSANMREGHQAAGPEGSRGERSSSAPRPDFQFGHAT